MKPITPAEAEQHVQTSIPDAVFEAFNELIAENYIWGESKVKLHDVVSRMMSKGIDRDEANRKGYLNVEPYYEKAGWKVIYDKPGYNEQWYEPFFVFKKR